MDRKFFCIMGEMGTPTKRKMQKLKYGADGRQRTGHSVGVGK